MPSVHGYPDHNFAVFARDAKDSLTPNETQRNTLIVAGVYVVAIFILWCALCFASLAEETAVERAG